MFERRHLATCSNLGAKPIVSVIWSPDSEAIATLSADGTVGLITLGEVSVRRLPKPEGKPLKSICWGRSSRELVAVSPSGSGRFILDDASPVYSRGGNFGGTALASDRKRSLLGVISSQIDEGPRQPRRRRHNVSLVDLQAESEKSILSLIAPRSYPTVLAFSPGADALFVGRYDGRLQVLDFEGERIAGASIFDSVAVTALAIAPDEQVFVGSNDGRVEVRDAQLAPIEDCAPFKLNERIASMSVNSRTGDCAVLSRAGKVGVWNRQGRHLCTLAGEGAGWTSVAYDSTGTRFAAATGRDVLFFDVCS